MKKFETLFVGLAMISSLAVAQIDPDPNGIKGVLALDTIFFSLGVKSCF